MVECKTPTNAIVVVNDAFACKMCTHFADIEESDIQWDNSTLVEPIFARKLLAETPVALELNVTVFPPVEVA